MEESTKAHGKTINYMVKDSILGEMEENTMDSMLKIRSKVLELTSGQTAASMKAIGMMESSTVKANFITPKANAK